MKKTNQEIAIEVIAGKWGNGNERRMKLAQAGYNYDSVQNIVNAIMEGDMSPISTPVEPEAFEITGSECMEIEIDLTKYNSLSIKLTNGNKSEVDELLEGCD